MALTADEVKVRLEGPVNSIPTPFQEDGAVDWDGVARIIDTGIEGGSRVSLLTYGDSQMEFLADDEVELSTKSQGIAKGVLGGEGIFILRAEGPGDVIVSSYGAIHEVELKTGETYIVDNGHLVAWDCDYKIEKATKGWISSFTSGEGFVCRFQGPGTVFLQTRNLGPLASALMPFMPRPSS